MTLTLSRSGWTSRVVNPARCPVACLQRGDVLSLRAFLPLGDFHRDLLTFVQRSAPLSLYGGKMYKYILSTFSFDEAESLFVVKPLHRTGYLL